MPGPVTQEKSTQRQPTAAELKRRAPGATQPTGGAAKAVEEARVSLTPPVAGAKAAGGTAQTRPTGAETKGKAGAVAGGGEYARKIVSEVSAKNIDEMIRLSSFTQELEQ
ncbi:hypothetical protein HK102_000361, partial [Quaeritorhiza haematococci]